MNEDNRIVIVTSAKKVDLDTEIFTEKWAVNFLIQPIALHCITFPNMISEFDELEQTYLINLLKKYYKRDDVIQQVLTASCLFYLLFFSYARCDNKYNITANLLNFDIFGKVKKYKPIKEIIPMSYSDNFVLRVLEGDTVRANEKFKIMLRIQFLSTLLYYRGIKTNVLESYIVEEKPFDELDEAFKWAAKERKSKFVECLTGIFEDEKNFISFLFGESIS